jgi:hypothetical protein
VSCWDVFFGAVDFLGWFDGLKVVYVYLDAIEATLISVRSPSLLWMQYQTIVMDPNSNPR